MVTGLDIGLTKDDELLLQAGKGMLEPKFNTLLFSSPENCLNYFSTYTSHLSETPFLQGKAGHEDYDNINHLPIDLNISSSINTPSKAQQITEISVLIVDYRMPTITGIELCRQLKNIPAKKILLTGEANNKTAISALDEGIINCFINKGSENLVPDLIDHINNLTLTYFIEARHAI